MNIDEFLAENNLQVLYTLPTSLIWPPGPPAGGSSGEPSQGGDQPRAGRAQLRLPQHDELRFSATCGREPCFKALHHRLKRWLCSTCPLPDQPNSQIRCDQVLLSAPTTSSTRSRSAPSWRGRRRRGARDGKLRSSLRLRFEHSALNYFSPKNTLQDLALATVPGADFDPSERAFDMEELRPQPIIRKRAKQFVSAEKKDDKYWESRTKNTIAARRWDWLLNLHLHNMLSNHCYHRSREARRLKENQIALRAAFLEKENVSLRKDVEEANAALARQKMEVGQCAFSFDALTRTLLQVAILREKMARFEAGIYSQPGPKWTYNSSNNTSWHFHCIYSNK